MIKIGIVVVAVIAVVIVAVIVLGAVTPKKHSATVTVKLKRAPADIYAAIADLASWPSWNPSVKEVARLPDVNAHAVWKVVDAHDHAIPYEIVEATPARFVTRIADESLPFGGTWTWTVADDGTVTIVEDGVIKNVVFRAISRTVLGYTSGEKRALTALAATFGETVTPVEKWRYLED